MTISFSEDELRELQQVRDLLSHVVPDGSWRDIFMYLGRKEIKRVVGKSSDQINSDTQLNSGVPGVKQVTAKRKLLFPKEFQLRRSLEDVDILVSEQRGHSC